jgi:hypothetical protein
VALAHALVVSVRRRAGDFAVLRSLGFRDETYAAVAGRPGWHRAPARIVDAIARLRGRAPRRIVLVDAPFTVVLVVARRGGDASPRMLPRRAEAAAPRSCGR